MTIGLLLALVLMGGQEEWNGPYGGTCTMPSFPTPCHFDSAAEWIECRDGGRCGPDYPDWAIVHDGPLTTHPSYPPDHGAATDITDISDLGGTLRTRSGTGTIDTDPDWPRPGVDRVHGFDWTQTATVPMEGVKFLRPECEDVERMGYTDLTDEERNQAGVRKVHGYDVWTERICTLNIVYYEADGRSWRVKLQMEEEDR